MEVDSDYSKDMYNINRIFLRVCFQRPEHKGKTGEKIDWNANEFERKLNDATSEDGYEVVYLEMKKHHTNSHSH